VGDEAVGLGILRRALEAPLRQIADNAGAHGEVVVEKVKGLESGHGFDALKGEYGDMFAKGIVEPGEPSSTA
jgi:chaperonin GroEL